MSEGLWSQLQAEAPILLHDPQDGDWALWQRTAGGLATVRVSWSGALNSSPWYATISPSNDDGVTPRARCYVLTEELAAACIMAASAFDSPEKWWAFAARMAASLEKES